MGVFRSLDRYWDPLGRVTRVRQRQVLPASGSEVTLCESGGVVVGAGGGALEIPTYSACDVYVRLPVANVGSFLGSTWRIYSVVGAAASLEAVANPFPVAPASLSSVRAVALRGRGGVERFRVTVQLDPAAGPAPGGGTVDDLLEVDLVTYDVGESAGASPAPVVLPVGLPIGGTYDTPAAYLASRSVVVGARRLLRAWAQLDPAAVGARWIHVFDKAALPALGDAPVLSAWIQPSAAASWALDGLPCVLGISWGVSTTRDTFTASVDLAHVGVEYQ